MIRHWTKKKPKKKVSILTVDPVFSPHQVAEFISGVRVSGGGEINSGTWGLVDLQNICVARYKFTDQAGHPTVICFDFQCVVPRRFRIKRQGTGTIPDPRTLPVRLLTCNRFFKSELIGTCGTLTNVAFYCNEQLQLQATLNTRFKPRGT